MKSCKRIVRLSAVGFLVFLFNLGYTQTAEQIQGLLKERVDTYQQSPGIVVGVVDSSGRHVFAYGSMGRDLGPVNGRTLFEIGSITKVFTCVVLADFVLRGDLELDTPISRFLPPDATNASTREITLLELATHTSGLPRLPTNFEPGDPDNPYADFTVRLLYDFLRQYERSDQTSRSYAYSNLGMGLLGHLLTLHTGTDYETLVVRHICDPLQLVDTRIVLSEDQKRRLAVGHNVGGEPVKNWDIPVLAGAGALRSTAEDLLTFLAANLGWTPTELDSAFRMTWEPRFQAGSRDAWIGLGWHILKKHGSEIIWHGGGTGGYRAFVGFDPERKKGVVVLANSANRVDDLGLHLLNPRFELAELKPPRRAIEVAPEILATYVGEYELAPSVIFTITREGNQLYAQLTGQQRYPIFPETENRFFYRVVDAQITFVKNEQGEVTHLVLHQFGLDQKAPKRKQPGVALNEKKEITLAPEVLQRYVGKYELRPGVFLTVTRQGQQLMAQVTGQPAVPIFPESETRFFYKVVNAQIEFHLDENKRVSGLTFSQSGYTFKAPKVE